MIKTITVRRRPVRLSEIGYKYCTVCGKRMQKTFSQEIYNIDKLSKEEMLQIKNGLKDKLKQWQETQELCKRCKERTDEC